MKKSFLIVIAFLLGTVVSLSQSPEPLRVLAFSKTNNFRYGIIPQSLVTLGELGQKNNWEITATEDSLVFSPDVLNTIDVIIFLHTSGNILGDQQQKALEDFVTNGGGLVTLHTGTITENKWPWFVETVGAIFTGHPPVQKGTLVIEDRNHPATAHFPDSLWTTTDEWYTFDRNPREHVHVLMSIDESSYNAGDKHRMGDHPLVWTNTMGQGRVFQTALGHAPALYKHPFFLNHLEGGILWAGKRK
ncbi:MAG: ThuA domain-containing protein [Bacteroidales bacterium]|nr:ThuA domain-containing protein [Bacteroidales bacterium]